MKNKNIKKGNEKKLSLKRWWKKKKVEVQELAVYAINKNNKFWSIENAKWNGKQSLINILNFKEG